MSYIGNSPSTVAGAAITMADQWRLTTDKGDGDITSSLERVDEASSGIIGTGMTESSGIFSFPETGIYLIMVNAAFNPINSDSTVVLDIKVTVDNTTYDSYSISATGGNSGSSTVGQGGSGSAIIDVTDTANVKVKFAGSSIAGGSSILGSTSQNRTSFTFIRLGDT